MNTDVRWKQRFSNYQRALLQLEGAITLMRQRELSDLEKQGVVQAFEFTYELGWNTLKDYLLWQGITGVTGSRDTIREAFSVGLIAQGDVWMNMLIDRNRTSHSYNAQTAKEILSNIDDQYLALLLQLSQKLHELDLGDS